MKPALICAYLLLVTGLAGCDTYPKDPLSTLEEAKSEGLAVGVIQAPPWVEMAGGDLRGMEVDLVKGFAKTLGTEINWVRGSETELMRILEAHELHVVIGGLSARTPWKKSVGLTNSWIKENIIVCHTTPGPLPDEIKGLSVAAIKGSAVIADVKNKDAVPNPVDSFAGYSGLMAMSELDSARAECGSDTRVIKTNKHVIAVARGENALLMALEEYLNAAGY